MKLGVCLVLLLNVARAQEGGAPVGPDPREIPLPRIATKMGTLPGAAALPGQSKVLRQQSLPNGHHHGEALR